MSQPLWCHRLQRRSFITGAAALLCSTSAILVSGPAAAQSLADIVRSAQNPRTAQPLKNARRVTNDGLFGTIEFTSDSLGALPQWRRILARMKEELPAFARCTNDPDHCTTPARQSWRRLMRSAAPLGRIEKLHAVNRFFNRWPYKQDREVYGRSEYWATPSEFMMRSGDCEDYSIAKFFALRQLGFRNDEMRIVIIYDTIRAIGHAVTAIYEKDDVLILDSLSNLITTHRRYKQYIPQYSMNETMRWAHVDRRRKIPLSAFRVTKP